MLQAQGETHMNKSIKLTVAGLIVALATSVGMAAPADAAPVVSSLSGPKCC